MFFCLVLLPFSYWTKPGQYSSFNPALGYCILLEDDNDNVGGTLEYGVDDNDNDDDVIDEYELGFGLPAREYDKALQVKICYRILILIRSFRINRIRILPELQLSI